MLAQVPASVSHTSFFYSSDTVKILQNEVWFKRKKGFSRTLPFSLTFVKCYGQILQYFTPGGDRVFPPSMDNAQHTLTNLPEDVSLASIPCLHLPKHLPAASPSSVTCPAHYMLVTCVFQGQLGFYFLFCYVCYNCCCRWRFRGWLRRWRWCLYRCSGLRGLKCFFRVRAPGENQIRDRWAEWRLMFPGHTWKCRAFWADGVDLSYQATSAFPKGYFTLQYGFQSRISCLWSAPYISIYVT